MAGRVSQIILESVNGAASTARASQLVLETVVLADGNLRVSQVTIETMIGAASNTRVSQLVAEVLRGNPAIVSQLVLEVLIVTPVPVAQYPQLPGLAFPVVRRAVWRTGAGGNAGGRSVRVPFSPWPTWEWDLTYELLPDQPRYGLTASDLQTLVGFFLANAGGAGWFAYQDDTFNQVQAQAIGIGDGTTTSFVLAYTAGLGSFSIVEPIGLLNQSGALNVYLNGVLASPATYSYSVAVPHNQTLSFASAPGAGVVVSVDMQFFYAARFKDDVNDFEQFMSKLWTAKKITLQSVFG